MNNGCTALFRACFNNHANVVQQLLLVSKIDINRSNSHNVTPLLMSAYLGNYECVQQLLQHSKINTTLTFQNKTALQWSQPNERVNGWEVFESKINTKGRKKILQLF